MDATLSPSLLQRLEPFRLPALHLVGTEGPTNSRLGGQPLVPIGFEWPHFEGKQLPFIAQIDLEALPETEGIPRLPSSGLLSIFCDFEASEWGEDPDAKESWRVFHFNVPMSELVAAQYPEELEEACRSIPKYIGFKPVSAFPPTVSPEISKIFLEENVENDYEVFEFPYEGQPMHHLFGHPELEQDYDIRESCERGYRRIPYDAPEPEYPSEIEEFKAAQSQWKLLVQIHSDRDAGFMWGDFGKLYFCIREEDLAVANFNDVWMVMQCG